MANVAADTASPEVVPTLTKTDARELKSLVSRDTKVLLEELEFRNQSYEAQLHRQYVAEQEAIRDERKSREEADQALLSREMSKISRRIDTLNKAIVATLEELEDAGWRTPGATTIVNKGHWMVPERSTRLLPPDRDDSDLADREDAAREAYQQASQELSQAYREARRVTTGREADVLRDLTLQSITTEAAREFILEMPTSDDLLPAPKGLEALPPPVGAPEVGDE